MNPGRRQLLTAMGLGGGSLFLPSFLGDRAARAAAPRRLVIFFTRHGPTYETWRMRGPGLPDRDADWELPLDTLDEGSFSTVLKPLYKQRKNVVVLDGLAITSAFADKQTNNHNAGSSHMLTGAKMALPAGFNNEGSGGDLSVDQIIANQVAVPGRIKSLYYNSMFAPFAPVFEGPNKPARGEESPARAFERLFPTGTPAPAGSPDQADFVRRNRPAIADLVKNEYAALLPRLGAEDRQKLQRHRDLVADLETQIRLRPSISCAAPAKIDGGSTLSVSARNKLFAQLVTAAMSCDLTRVAVISAGQMSTGEFGAPAGDVHQDIAHQATAGSAAATHMASYYAVHAAQFADLVGQFEAAGLLESSMLLWLTELANGPHDLYRIMAVMAGSAGGAVRTGRYIKYKETEPNPAAFVYGGGNKKLGPAHSKLLVSAMQAMGLDRTSLGITAAAGNGSTGSPGARIDLTGPLPRLR